MNVCGVVVAVLALAVLVLAVRWQYGRTMEQVTSGDHANPIPVSTPFTSSLCTASNNYCRNLNLNPDFDSR